MEQSPAALLLTQPVVVVMVLILTNWRDTGVTTQLVPAYASGIAAGVRMQQYPAAAAT